MNILANDQMPIWGWIVIIPLGIIGVGVAIWGMFSAGTQRKKIFKANKLKGKIDIIEEILKSKAINLAHVNKNQTGIFVMVCGEVNVNEYFVPMYLFETDDFDNHTKILLTEIVNNETPFAIKINEYLSFKGYEINEIKFTKVNYSLEEILTNTNLDKRGFAK